MGVEPTNLHRYQESEYAAGREISAFRLEFVGFLTGVVIKPPSCGTYISLLIHYPRPQYSMYPGMSFRIDKRMLQGREQLDFSRAAADPAIVGQLEK
jgi:hypothetical protein